MGLENHVSLYEIRYIIYYLLLSCEIHVPATQDTQQSESRESVLQSGNLKASEMAQ